MSVTVIPVDPGRLMNLNVALDAWVSLIASDRSAALVKAARLLDLGMQKAFRQSPPRPNAGKITREAVARGYKMAKNTASWITGLNQAKKMLGGAKSGFFRIVDKGDGKKTAVAVGYTAKGRITYVKSGKLRRGANLLTSLSGQTKRPITQLPADVHRLNLQALATNRALTLREKAGAGGYISSEFLTYRKINASTKSTQFVTKDGVTVGAVTINTDDAGNPVSVVINANIPGVSEVAARTDAVNKGFDSAVETFSSDIISRLNSRFERALGKVAK